MATFEEQNLVQHAEQLIADQPSIKSPSLIKKLWSKLKWWLFGLTIIFLGWFIYAVFFQKVNFLSPLALGEVLSVATRRPDRTYEVVGFLPYWSVNRGAEIPWQALDEVIIFDLSVDSQGDIGQTRQDEIGGWSVLNSKKFNQIQQQAIENNTLLGLALTSFNDEQMNLFLSNSSAVNNFLDQLDDILDEYQLQTINIDFEFVNLSQPETTREAFNQLIAKIKTRFPDKKLSFDVYANAVIKNQPYDIQSLGRLADRMIIMAYDFHRPSSANSGPVAPINQPYASARSITEALRESFKLISPQKTLLGVPLYGYEWQTANDQIYSTSLGSDGLASFSRTHDLITEKDLEVKWDNQALSPWISFTDDSGRIKQIYFENLSSLSLKYQLVKQSGLAGVAYWALGYEGDYTDVWQEVDNSLKSL